MSRNTIPVLDLTDYQSLDPARKQSFVKGVGDALRDVGFFALTNHGVDIDVIDKSYALAEQLFLLSDDAKRNYENAKIRGQRGYTSFGREHAKGNDAPDLKEFWHVGQELTDSDKYADVYAKNLWPNEIPYFKPVMLDLFKKLEDSALTVLEACAIYIGEPKDSIRDIAVMGNSILRLIHYPPIADEAHPASVRAAPHEDINLITLLIDATAPGLEILTKEGHWLPVVTPPGCIIIDSGDMLQNLTNGFFKSTTHRVTNPNNSRERRFSMPFFMHARSEVNLSPLKSCVEKTGGEVAFSEITAGEYLHQRLQEIGLA